MAVTNFHTKNLYIAWLSCRTLGKIPRISRMTPAAICIHATRSCCVSTWMTPLATDGSYVEAPSLTWHDTGYMKTRVYETPLETQEDIVARIQVAAGVISDMPGFFPKVRYDIIRRYSKCIEVDDSHICKWINGVYRQYFHCLSYSFPSVCGSNCLLSVSHFLIRGRPSMPLSCHRNATVRATCGTVW